MQNTEKNQPDLCIDIRASYGENQLNSGVELSRLSSIKCNSMHSMSVPWQHIVPHIPDKGMVSSFVFYDKHIETRAEDLILNPDDFDDDTDRSGHSYRIRDRSRRMEASLWKQFPGRRPNTNLQYNQR
jgi:hypothetical protein